MTFAVIHFQYEYLINQAFCAFHMANNLFVGFMQLAWILVYSLAHF